MNITEVRVSLVDSGDDQLLAFCTITFDRAFVVRDIRVINGPNGPFVAMPSRRVSVSCNRCHAKNYVGSKFCSECGTKMPPVNQIKTAERQRGYVDIAHPINAKARDQVQSAILQCYDDERAKSRQPGYRPAEPDGTSTTDPNSLHSQEKPEKTKTPHWKAGRPETMDSGLGVDSSTTHQHSSRHTDPN